MTTFHVTELRIGHAVPFGPAGALSAIDKHKVDGPVRAEKFGLDGDQQGDGPAQDRQFQVSSERGESAPAASTGRSRNHRAPPTGVAGGVSLSILVHYASKAA